MAEIENADQDCTALVRMDQVGIVRMNRLFLVGLLDSFAAQGTTCSNRVVPWVQWEDNSSEY